MAPSRHLHFLLAAQRSAMDLGRAGFKRPGGAQCHAGEPSG